MVDFFEKYSVGGVYFLALLFLFIRTFLGIGGGFLWSKLAKHKVYDLPYAKGQLNKELNATLITLLLNAMFITLCIKSGWFDSATDTAGMVIWTYLFMFVFFEIWFYLIHRLVHHPKLYFIHRQHHIARVASPLSALSFSFIEKILMAIGFWIIPMALSHVMPISFLGVFIYTTLNFFFNVLGHMNIEIYPESYVDSFVGRQGTTPTYHSMHHARFNSHYGLFLIWFDKMFGTYDEDYPRLFKEVATGHPMAKLKQRVKENA